MTDAEQREAARQFANKWKGRGREDEDGRSYWIDFLSNVLGMENVTDRVEFEKKVVVDGNTKRIDVYIPETHVLIEQKSLGKALDHKIMNSGSIELTPYDQAKRYNDNLPYDERNTPKYAAALANPIGGIVAASTLLLGTFVAKNIEKGEAIKNSTVDSEEIKKILKENLVTVNANIKNKKKAIAQLEQEIVDEETKVKSLEYLLKNIENVKGDANE